MNSLFIRVFAKNGYSSEICTLTSISVEMIGNSPIRAYVCPMKLRAVIHVAEEGGFWAEVPALLGCVTQGETLVDLKRNLTEVVQGWLLAGEPDDSIPSERLLEVAV